MRLILVEADGRERTRAAVAHPAEVRVGQELWLDIDGSRRLVRVLRLQGGGAGDRLVYAIEILLRCPFCRADLLAVDGPAGLESDTDGECVTCRACGRRVAMERVPTTPPGGPARLRVASEQERWVAWE
jgi:DNA-directed RNA polymerase subunit RPC12/RpoP